MFIRTCAWCFKGRLFGRLMGALGFDISHGACGGCNKKILAEIEKLGY